MATQHLLDKETPLQPVELVPITPADLAEATVLAEAFHAEDGHPLDDGGRRALAELAAGEPLARGWLIREQEAVVGYAVLTLGYSIEFGGRDGFLDDLYLVPAVRGRGLGSAIVALLEVEARSLGARALHLVIDPRNEPAKHVYRRNGFEVTDWCLMSRRL